MLSRRVGGIPRAFRGGLGEGPGGGGGRAGGIRGGSTCHAYVFVKLGTCALQLLST